MYEIPKHCLSHIQWHMPAIPAFRRLRQGCEKIKVILDHIVNNELA